PSGPPPSVPPPPSSPCCPPSGGMSPPSSADPWSQPLTAKHAASKGIVAERTIRSSTPALTSKRSIAPPDAPSRAEPGARLPEPLRDSRGKGSDHLTNLYGTR